jgi:hypothetical protein
VDQKTRSPESGTEFFYGKKMYLDISSKSASLSLSVSICVQKGERRGQQSNKQTKKRKTKKKKEKHSLLTQNCEGEEEGKGRKDLRKSGLKVLQEGRKEGRSSFLFAPKK